MTKRNKTIYWISTLWLASGMLATGTLQLIRAKAEGALAPPGVYGITHLGYPIYFLTILGVWKILGVVAVLIPRFPLLKEWAYAGFVFAMTGAAFFVYRSGRSHERIGSLVVIADPDDGLVVFPACGSKNPRATQSPGRRNRCASSTEIISPWLT